MSLLWARRVRIEIIRRIVTTQTLEYLSGDTYSFLASGCVGRICCENESNDGMKDAAYGMRQKKPIATVHFEATGICKFHRRDTGKLRSTNSIRMPVTPTPIQMLACKVCQKIFSRPARICATHDDHFFAGPTGPDTRNV